jgi:hypothetical protein
MATTGPGKQATTPGSVGQALLDRLSRGWWFVLGTSGGIGILFSALAVSDSAPWASIGAAGIMALGASIGGSLVGFLFGLPRSKGPVGSRAYAPNSNFEEMSDWLTKIIIGLGLIQLGAIADAFLRASEAVRVALGLRAGSQPIAAALILTFGGIGFLSTYLYARTRLAGTFALADEFQDLLPQVQSAAADAANQAASSPRPARHPLASEFHGLVGNLRQIRESASALPDSDPSATTKAAAAWLAANKGDLDKLESDSRDAEQSPDGVLDVQLPQLVQRAHELADSYRDATGGGVSS